MKVVLSEAPGARRDGAAADGNQRIGHDDVGQRNVAGVGDSEGVADGLTDLGEAVAVLILERAALDDGNAGVLVERRHRIIVF